MFHVKQITFKAIVRGADVREVDIYSIKDIVKLTLSVFINGGYPILRYSSIVRRLHRFASQESSN